MYLYLYIHQIDHRCGTHNWDEKRIQNFGRSVSTKEISRHISRSEDNIKTDDIGLRLDVLYGYIGRTSVTMVMSPGFHKKWRISWTSERGLLLLGAGLFVVATQQFACSSSDWWSGSSVRREHSRHVITALGTANTQTQYHYSVSQKRIHFLCHFISCRPTMNTVLPAKQLHTMRI